MSRLLVGLSAMAGTFGMAWMVTPHHPQPVHSVCAVTLHVDGSWSQADPSDSDALHYSC